jgi:hypothetical protein
MNAAPPCEALPRGRKLENPEGSDPYRRQRSSELKHYISNPNLNAKERLFHLLRLYCETRYIDKDGPDPLYVAGLAVRNLEELSREIGISDSHASRVVNRLVESGALWRGKDRTNGLVLAFTPVSAGEPIARLHKVTWDRFEPSTPAPAMEKPASVQVSPVPRQDEAASMQAPYKGVARALTPEEAPKELNTTPTPPPAPASLPAAPPPRRVVVVDPPRPPRSKVRRRATPPAPPRSQAARLLDLAEPLPAPCQVPTAELQAALERRGFDTLILEDLLPAVTQLLTREHLRDLLDGFDRQAATPTGVLQPRALLRAITFNILSEATSSPPRNLCPSMRAFRENPHSFALSPLEDLTQASTCTEPPDELPSELLDAPTPLPTCSLERMEPLEFLQAFQALPEALQRQAEVLARPFIEQAQEDDQLSDDARTRRIHYVLAVQLRGLVP